MAMKALCVIMAALCVILKAVRDPLGSLFTLLLPLSVFFPIISSGSLFSALSR